MVEPRLESEINNLVMVDGAEIKNVRTINSMYANNNVIVTIPGTPHVRIKCSTLLWMMQHFDFIGVKARKYTYLDEAVLKRKE